MRILILLLASVIPLSVAQAADTAEALVEEGLATYKKSGAKAAIEAWIKGSSLDGGKEALSQANILRQIEDYYGTLEDYAIIKSNKMSKRTKMILFVMNYNRGVTFGKFQAYQDKNGSWIATQFKFNTNVSLVWPDSMIYGE